MPLIRRDPPSGAAPARAFSVDGSTDQRWDAARRLATAPDGEVELIAALAHETDPRVREAIFTGLVRIGGAVAIGAVVACIASDDASRRTGALDALHAAPESAEPFLDRLLGDADADVRLLACDLLRDQPPQAASQRLTALLDGETEINVCAAALETLAEVGGPEISAVLDRCAARFADEPFLTFAIRATRDRLGAQAPDPT